MRGHIKQILTPNFNLRELAMGALPPLLLKTSKIRPKGSEFKFWTLPRNLKKVQNLTFGISPQPSEFDPKGTEFGVRI